MLAVPLKEAKAVDWGGPLRSYLQNNYSETELGKHSGAIQRLCTLREQCVNASGAKASSIDALENYLTMLGEVEPRFPLGEGGLKISFTWFDALKPTKKMQGQSVLFERACVLFNLGAVFSHQGMLQDRSDPLGLKKACLHFQQAAGIFVYLREELLGNEYTGPVLSDMSPEGLEMLSNLMLAQAQACFYEQALRGQKSVSVLAKLAAEAAVLYGKAWECSKASSLVPTLDKAWGTHLEFQYRCFTTSSQFQYSKVIHEQAEKTTKGYGEEIARLAYASELAEAALHCGRINKLPASMLDSVGSLRSTIHKVMDEATDNNNRIYMELVPNKRDLSTPKGHALAKPLPPDDKYLHAANLASSETSFPGLLPVHMQEAQALFASKLSDLVETSGRRVISSSEEIKLRLAEAGLPAAVEAGDGSNGLPKAVWERMQSVVNSNGEESLRERLDSNKSKARKIESTLDNIEKILAEEESADLRCRSTWGDKWNLTMSGELSLHMRSDVTRLRKLCDEAKNSDNILLSKLEEVQKSNKLAILKYSKDRLDGMFPSSDDVDNAPEVESMREELALMLVTLGSNLQEVEQLQNELVEDSSSASIANAMANYPGGSAAAAASSKVLNNLVERELGRFDPILQAIEEKISEQPRLISNVLDLNHGFSAIRNQSPAMLKREGIIAEIDRALNALEELVFYQAEGEKFYQNLQGRINQLEVTAMDHTYVRDMQRKELESILSQRAAQGSSPTATVASATPSASASAYPGMARPGFDRQVSTPSFQPYAATAQAFPVDQAVAPAYPVGSPSASASAPPPPAYSASTASSNPGNGAKLVSMRSALGNELFTTAQMEAALDGADGDVNRAINHLFASQDASTPTASSSPPPNNNRRSKKRFGLFK